MSKPKLIEQIENAGGVFIATYGTTTNQEIKAAYDSGKDIIVIYDDYIYELITIPTGSNNLAFHRRDFSNDGYATTAYSHLLLQTDNTWHNFKQGFGNVVAPLFNNEWQTSISSSTGYYRPIRISTSEPTASDGNIGDIWIQYEE